MTFIPLDIPAGVYKNGTDLEGQGRWQDTSLVRWRDNTLRPVGGWQSRKAGFSTNPIRGFHTWEANDGSRFFAGGSYNELKVSTADNTVYDITPSDLTAGDEHSTLETGYGYGNYGVGTYGTERSAFGSYSEANSWQIDNFGENLIACSYADGRLLEWTLNVSNDAAVITNAPTNNLGVVVTEERFVFALGAGGNPRKVQWCDIEDNTDWTPTAANQSGDIELQTAGQIMQGIRTRGQVLILTDIDAHTARYSGPPFVYGFQRVGTACGAISRMAAVDTDAGVFWMGQRGFFRFDGNVVQEMPCDVFDHVFGELQDRNKSKTWAFNNSEFGEVWWFYQSDAQSDSGEIDKYVAYDYKENHWHIGSLSRTAGAPRGVFRNAFMVDSTDVYHHEVAGTGATGMFAETGPIQLGNGDNIMHVTQFVADERTKGDVQLKFKTRFYPNGDETEHGPFDPATPTGLRLAGRQLKMRIEPDDGADFRVGIVRVDAQQGGKR